MKITFIFVYMNYVIISQHTLVHCKVDSNMTVSSCHISSLKIIFDVEGKTNKNVFLSENDRCAYVKDVNIWTMVTTEDYPHWPPQ